MGSTAAEWIDRFKKYDAEVLVDLVREQIDTIGVERWVAECEPVDDEEAHDLRQSLALLRWKIEELPGRRLVRMLRDSMNPVGQEIDISAPDEMVIEHSPSWDTGIPAVDLMTGGGQGMVVVAGQPKLGKSLVGVSAAVNAARMGWRVIYVNAELTRGGQIKRFSNAMRGEMDHAIVSQIHIANVGPGLTMERFVDEVDPLVAFDDEKVLIVLDSINRIVDLAVTEDGENAYWKLLRDWSNWAMTSRRVSEGKISWLIVSELAAAGHVKGRTLEYVADLVIRMRDSDIMDTVNIDVPYSRYSRSGEAGDHTRDFARGRFIYLGNQVI
tara:strand:- start:14978 stop:15958 length:981 start_codon:yes stop_codon:yes gene_type:complete